MLLIISRAMDRRAQQCFYLSLEVGRDIAGLFGQILKGAAGPRGLRVVAFLGDLSDSLLLDQPCQHPKDLLEGPTTQLVARRKAEQGLRDVDLEKPFCIFPLGNNAQWSGRASTVRRGTAGPLRMNHSPSMPYMLIRTMAGSESLRPRGACLSFRGTSYASTFDT